MIQNEVEKAFIKAKTGDIVEDVFMKEFPYGNIFVQIFMELMTYIIPIFLVISTFATVSGVIKVNLILVIYNYYNFISLECIIRAKKQSQRANENHGTITNDSLGFMVP